VDQSEGLLIPRPSVRIRPGPYRLSFIQAESCRSFGREPAGGATRGATGPVSGVVRLRNFDTRAYATVECWKVPHLYRALAEESVDGLAVVERETKSGLLLDLARPAGGGLVPVLPGWATAAADLL
jgi:hypothetical protein